MNITKIVITGGHHSSALPVIEELRKRYGNNLRIFWFGHRHSLRGDKNDTLEYLQITQLNIPFYELQAGKAYRTFNPLQLLKVPFGFLQAFFLLLKIHPDVILSFGGYLAVPTVIAGFILGIPSLTHEQTVVVGYANKLVSLFARKILISWSETAKYFPTKKVVMTGLPLRSHIFKANTHVFNLNANLPTVFVIAGKTGSHKINLAIKESLKDLLAVCNLIHQCGDYSKYNDYDMLLTYYQQVCQDRQDMGGQAFEGQYNLKKFILDDEIGEAFAKASLVISRAGAHITMELLALQKPCVLIPIPWVSHNEQYENAKIVEEAGLGTIFEEKALDSLEFKTVILNALIHLKDFKPKNIVNSKNRNVILEAPKRIVDEIEKL